jgi:tetratricopeptide (TPR) repeat protein
MQSALLLWVFLCIGALTLNGQVKVWEGTMPLAASDEGPPDENPNFDAFAELEDYPYTMRQDIRATETVHSWHALYLENEYLKCTVLPQLGGHIYTCVDKVNGKPMFYANPSFKKAIIAYRGAWSAFGEEFNFPISHNWVSLSPVDWAYNSAADGSASVTVGNRDRVYGMDWTVEIVLRPGSTLLEEHVTLSNHSDARHHFFWWNNAGVEVWNDSRIYYPTQFTIEDGGANIDTWPVNLNGKDISVVGKQDASFEAFAYGTSESFMGIYNPHTDSGVVHWADPRTVPAKKFFSWGNDSNGLDWRTRLSDNHSNYVEVQSGLFRDQTTYEFLEPQQSIRFTEFWMPVRGIGSIARANLNGVLAIERTRQKDGRITLRVGFNANRAIPGAKITISDGEKNVLEEIVSLDPPVTWTDQIADLPADKTYTFLLASSSGESLLSHTERVYDVVPRDRVKPGPQPQVQAPDPKSWGEGDFLRRGTDLELHADYLNAWDVYGSGLAKFPSSAALLKAGGRLADGLWHYQEAATLLGKSEERDSSDAETHYYRGIAEAALDHPANARSELEAARNSPLFGPAGGILLAELMARQHDAAGALKVLEASCPASSEGNAKPEDLRCIEETVALERATGRLEAARGLADKSIPFYPTSLFLRNEAAKVGSHTGPAGPQLDRHLAADTNRILYLVLQYNRLGLYADSLELLDRSYPTVAPEDSEPGAPLPSTDPLLAYYRGFSREKLGKSGAVDYEAASQMPLRYIFPSEPDEITVLHAALAVNASDASAHFLLGTLFFSMGIVDPALEEWKLAESLNPKIPSLQASMGRVLLEMKKRPAEAAAEFQRGLQMEPGNGALYLGLNKAMQLTGKTPAQRAEMMKLFPDPANMPEPLVRALVEALRESGRNDEANAVLAHRFLPRKEGEVPLQPQK